MRSNYHITDLQPGSDFDGAPAEPQDDSAIGRLPSSKVSNSILKLWLTTNGSRGGIQTTGKLIDILEASLGR